MSSSAFRVTSAFVFGISLTVVTTSWAQASADESVAAGVEALAEARVDEARALFRKAMAASPGPDLRARIFLFDGVALSIGERDVDALSSFVRALRIQSALGIPAEFARDRVTRTFDCARGFAVGDLGDEAIRATVSGAPSTWSCPGEPKPLPEAKPEPPPPPGPPNNDVVVAPTAPDGDSAFPIAPLATGIGGGVLAAVGIGVGLSAVSQAEDGEFDGTRGKAQAGDIMLVSGAVVAVGSIVWFFLSN